MYFTAFQKTVEYQRVKTGTDTHIQKGWPGVNTSEGGPLRSRRVTPPGSACAPPSPGPAAGTPRGTCAAAGRPRTPGTGRGGVGSGGGANGPGGWNAIRGGRSMRCTQKPCIRKHLCASQEQQIMVMKVELQQKVPCD